MNAPAHTDHRVGPILVLEDNPIIALDLTRIVEAAGGVVAGPFDRIEPAMTSISECKPERALLNVQLHRNDVFSIASHLDALNIPFIFVTGAGETVKTEGYTSELIIQKPYTVEAIREFALCA